MVRRSAYWSVGGIDPVFRQAEDYDIVVKISRIFKVRAIQDIVCHYRMHDSNLSHMQVQDNFIESISIVSRYLPDPNAKISIRWYQTCLAVEEMRQGRIIDGLKRLLIKGDLFLFINKSITLILRKIFNYKY